MTRGGRGGDLPCPFSKIGKHCSTLGKNVLIVAICGLHFSCGFKSFQEKKNRNFTLQGLSFIQFRQNVHRIALIAKQLSCPEKFLVTRLYLKKSWMKLTRWVRFLWMVLPYRLGWIEMQIKIV